MTNLSSSTFTRRLSHDLLSQRQQILRLPVLLSRVLHGCVTTGLCTFDTSRLFLGITVAVGTDGFRVERYLLSLRCLWRWIGTLVLWIWALGWIRDDPTRQHGNARALRACIWGWTGQVATFANSVTRHSMAIYILAYRARFSAHLFPASRC